MVDHWKQRLLHRVGRELGPFVPADEFDRAPRFHQVQAEIQNQIALLKNELLLAVNDVRVELAQVRQSVGELSYQTALARQSVDPIEKFETVSKVGHLQNDVQRLQNQTGGLEQRLAETLVRLQGQDASLRGELLRQRRALKQPTSSNTPAPSPRAGDDFATCLERLKSLAPRAFALWEPLLPVNADAYKGFPTDSCSVEGHPLAELFGCFLTSILKGAVLDIGCGPQPIPSYLRDYPVAQIAGIDPLLPPTPHPFVFHHGVAECLPWDDASFQTVIAATSLDHVLLLDRALSEIRRVLTPTGRFVTWVSLVPGAPPYDPYSDTVERTDDFHLFHFDREWFEATCSEWFRVDEVFAFGAPYDSAFYSFAPRT